MSGAPDGKAERNPSCIEITPEMIRAGATAFFDGSEFADSLSEGFAEYYSERVLYAALVAREIPTVSPRSTERPSRRA